MDAQSRLGRVADAVRATADAATAYVVTPVGTALGLIGEAEPPESKSARKAARKVAAARALAAARAKRQGRRK
jgi:hypothetical protein